MTTRKSKATIDNVESLRNNLSEVFDALRDGDIAHNSAKVQLDYHALRQDENFKINFLHSKDK